MTQEELQEFKRVLRAELSRTDRVAVTELLREELLQSHPDDQELRDLLASVPRQVDGRSP